MLRFFDREAVCVSENNLNRQEILNWFLKNGLDEPVCVLDESGFFKGCITYYSLIVCQDITKALLTDSLTLDKDIWKNARSYSGRCKKDSYGKIEQLPVLDKDGYLVSFAWYDLDADRELRQLRELSECGNAYQFKDIFPQYDCVMIHEFNELAFFFAEYLKGWGIPVIVRGEMWEGYFESTAENALDYRTLHIYAEGVAPKGENWIENTFRSASVEFECVDTIYEKNIREGIIKDADGTEEDFLGRLRAAEAIVIEGTGTDALDAYDYLLGKGLDILCFVSGNAEERKRTLFGKRILSPWEVYTSGKDATWILPSLRGSAWWGMDRLDYIGYKRNERSFMLKDYVEPESGGLLHILKGHRIICAGETLLCRKLIQLLESKSELRECTIEYGEAEELDGGTVDEECFILRVVPYRIETGTETAMDGARKSRQQAVADSLYAHKIFHFSDYFSTFHGFLSLLKDYEETPVLKPKRVVLGSIEAYSGNMFIRELLDGHPSILMMNYGTLNEDLFWLCMGLSTLNTEAIVPAFRQMVMVWEKTKTNFSAMEEIACRLEYLLEQWGKESISSLDIFFMFHMAYQYVFYEGEEKSLETSIIYWEPHITPRSREEELTKWFTSAGIRCDIYEMVRNSLSKNGSTMKGLKSDWNRGVIKDILFFTSGAYMRALGDVQRTEFLERPEYENCTRTIIRFEDLKLRPEEELRKLCELWDIEWSDLLLESSRHGKTQYNNGGMKTGFDKGPVYNNYEVYFSELDRLRITLFCSVWQKRFGYPYMELNSFSRRELQELFLKPFRFEKEFDKCTGKNRTVVKLKFMNWVRRELQEERRLENLRSKTAFFIENPCASAGDSKEVMI